jgi:hypothetical protein
MQSSYSMLELSSATSSHVSSFVADMSEIRGAASLRARYFNKTDGNGQRTKVLVLFVRTGKEPLVERMINFFDKTAQNRLAVTEIEKRIPGLLRTARDAGASVAELPGAITVRVASASVEALNTVKLSVVTGMLETAGAAFKSAQGGPSVRGSILSRGCAGMLLLAGQASYEHDMRLVRQHLGVGKQISEDDFSKRFYSFAVFASMLAMLIHNHDSQLTDQQSKGIDKGSMPRPLSAADLTVEQRTVIDEGLGFCKLWIAATQGKAKSGQDVYPTAFQSLQGWAIGEMACVAAPLLGHAKFSGQPLPPSLYGMSDLARGLPQGMNNKARTYMHSHLVFSDVDLGHFLG